MSNEKRLWIIEARDGAWGANGICKGELVRCGECEHRKPPTDYCEKLRKAYVPDDFYCKYGERKEKGYADN